MGVIPNNDKKLEKFAKYRQHFFTGRRIFHGDTVEHIRGVFYGYGIGNSGIFAMRRSNNYRILSEVVVRILFKYGKIKNYTFTDPTSLVFGKSTNFDRGFFKNQQLKSDESPAHPAASASQIILRESVVPESSMNFSDFELKLNNESKKPFVGIDLCYLRKDQLISTFCDKTSPLASMRNITIQSSQDITFFTEDPTMNKGVQLKPTRIGDRYQIDLEFPSPKTAPSLWQAKPTQPHDSWGQTLPDQNFLSLPSEAYTRHWKKNSPYPNQSKPFTLELNKFSSDPEISTNTQSLINEINGPKSKTKESIDWTFSEKDPKMIFSENKNREKIKSEDFTRIAAAAKITIIDYKEFFWIKTVANSEGSVLEASVRSVELISD
jgi:hypothetical protein